MPLARRAADQHGLGAGGRRRSADQRFDAAHGLRGGKVFLLHGGLIEIPERADLLEALLQDFKAHGFHRVDGEGLVDHLIRFERVKTEAGLYPEVAQIFHVVDRGGDHRLRNRLRQTLQRIARGGGFFPQFHRAADGQAFSLAGAQPFDHGHVVVGIQAVTAGGALRLGQVVAALPGAQHVGAQAGFAQHGVQVVDGRSTDRGHGNAFA